MSAKLYRAVIGRVGRPADIDQTTSLTAGQISPAAATAAAAAAQRVDNLTADVTAVPTRANDMISFRIYISASFSSTTFDCLAAANRPGRSAGQSVGRPAGTAGQRARVTT